MPVGAGVARFAFAMVDDSTVTTSDPPAAVPTSLLLVLSYGGAPIRTESLPARGAISIGRSRECGIAVDDGSLSRLHATLRLPELTIVDHGSRNGTWLGEARLAEGSETPVPLGKPFRLGHVSAVVVRVGAIDRGVLHQLDAQIVDARREKSAVILVRGAPPAAVPVGASVLARSDDRWLVSLACERERVAEVRRSLDPSAGVAVFPDHGADAGELYLAAERDRMRRRDVASPMDAVYVLADRVAAGTTSVLIQGETGVGKEVLAELVHRRSPRADDPLVKINCAAFAPSLFESQMFGHERGAFTGADAPAVGLIEAADGGTLFLDEIAELPLELQAKLLRVLEDRVVVRVGAVQGRRVDVRFVCATSEPLAKRVESGQFRADLYYRLSAVTLDIPPLRARTDEIEALAELFVLRVAETTRREAPALGAAALAKLRTYSWPGNIRQLRNAIERAVLMCDGPVIAPEHVLLDDAPPPPPAELPAQLDSHDPAHLVSALNACAGNQTRAARMLGISRNTLLARLDQFGLPRPRKKS